MTRSRAIGVYGGLTHPLDVVSHWGVVGDREMTNAVRAIHTLTTGADCEVTAITQWRNFISH